jgi:hypothetical protein
MLVDFLLTNMYAIVYGICHTLFRFWWSAKLLHGTKTSLYQVHIEGVVLLRFDLALKTVEAMFARLYPFFIF